ncbi:TPA: hypothetical protein ACQYCS_002680 [Vibrio parahaemolyticus]
MIPIYEQGSGQGIGHSVKSFLSRFEEISLNHISTGRAKSLAFVFYDYHDSDFKQILKNQGVFTKLDRLSGDKLSVFYMHSGSDRVLTKFNSTLMASLGVKDSARTPCVVFCKATSEGFSDISVANLDSPDLIHGFHEIYGVIDSYVNDLAVNDKPQNLSWVKSSIKFLSVESIKALIRELLKGGMF